MRTLILLLIFNMVCFVGLSAPRNYPAEVKLCNGAPTLHIDGKPVFADVFRSWPLEEDDYQKALKAMRKSGVRIVMPYLDLGKFWCDSGRYDYREITSKLDAVFKAAPDMYVLVLIGVHHKMDWWYYKHLDQRTIDGNAPQQKAPVQAGYATISFASDKFKKESSEALRKIIKFIESKYPGRCLGYQIGHGAYEEWIPWGLNKRKMVDFNPLYIAWFRKWLKEKYQTDSALQTAWHDSRVTIANARPFLSKNLKSQSPAKGRLIDPAEKKQLLDSREFMAHTISSTAVFYAGVVKQATAGKALMCMYAGANYQYQNMIEQLKCKDIDIFFSSTGYCDRDVDGVTYDQAIALESIKAHGKLYIHDADIRTFLFPDINYAYFGNNTDLGRCRNVRDSIMTLRREWGAMMVRGCGLAWLNILRKPVFLNPGIMRDIAVMNKVGNASAHFNRKSDAEIAVVVRQRPSHFSEFYYSEGYRTELYRLGAPVDIFISQDIRNIKPGRYKLIVFLMAQYLAPQTLAYIEQLKRGGTRILWSFGNGYITEKDFSLKAMRSLTGFEFSRTPGMLPWMKMASGKRYQVPAMIMGPHGSEYFTIKDAPGVKVLASAPDTGKTVFAQRHFKGWTSVYYPGYVIPAAVLREQARKAGVHLYTGEVGGFYCNRNFMIVSTPGELISRKISLPEPAVVYDVFQRKEIGRNIKSFELKAAPGSTTCLFYGSGREFDKFMKYCSYADSSQADWQWSKPLNGKFSLEVPGEPVRNICRGEQIQIPFRLESGIPDLRPAVKVDCNRGFSVSLANLPEKMAKGEIIYGKIKVKADSGLQPGDYILKLSLDKVARDIRIKVNPYIYLSDLPWDKAVCGWMSVKKDMAVSNNPLFLQGKRYRKGLGSHADSEIVWNINGKWRLLNAVIGIDDRAGKGRKGRATAIFEVVGDGRSLYRSPLLKGGENKQITVDVTGIKVLTLITRNGGDGKASDHTDWADAKLFK